MSGTPERKEHGIPERIREVLLQFDVDENRARLLLGCSAVLAWEKVAKWKGNLRRIQREMVVELLRLIEKGGSQSLEQAKQNFKKSAESSPGKHETPTKTPRLLSKAP